MVFVLGILAAVVIFALGTFNHDSGSAACATSGRTVQSAELAYSAHFGSYATIDELVSQHFLRGSPPGEDYTISVDAVSGDVTGSMNDNGDSCFPTS